MVRSFVCLYPLYLLKQVTSFLEGPKAALVASKDFDNGHYTSSPHHGIRAFGRVYSAWAHGQTVGRVHYKDQPVLNTLKWFRENKYLFDGLCVSVTIYLVYHP